MITLKLWSDQHRRTPIDIFVYEPFDFAKEFATAMTVEVFPRLTRTCSFPGNIAKNEARRWPRAGFNRYRGVTAKSVKTLEPIKADWKWGCPEGSRELDRLLDRQLTFCEKLEWLEEAEALSLHLRANRESQSNDNYRQRGER